MDDIHLRKRSSNKNGEVFDVMLNSRVVGDIRYKTGIHSGGATIAIYIKPYYRGRGYAEDAEDALAQRIGASKLYAEINADNARSERMHKKAGFEKLGSLWVKTY